MEINGKNYELIETETNYRICDNCVFYPDNCVLYENNKDCIRPTNYRKVWKEVQNDD